MEVLSSASRLSEWGFGGGAVATAGAEGATGVEAMRGAEGTTAVEAMAGAEGATGGEVVTGAEGTAGVEATWVTLGARTTGVSAVVFWSPV